MFHKTQNYHFRISLQILTPELQNTKAMEKQWIISKIDLLLAQMSPCYSWVIVPFLVRKKAEVKKGEKTTSSSGVSDNKLTSFSSTLHQMPNCSVAFQHVEKKMENRQSREQHRSLSVSKMGSSCKVSLYISKLNPYTFFKCFLIYWLRLYKSELH